MHTKNTYEQAYTISSHPNSTQIYQTLRAIAEERSDAATPRHIYSFFLNLTVPLVRLSPVPPSPPPDTITTATANPIGQAILDPLQGSTHATMIIVHFRHCCGTSNGTPFCFLLPTAPTGHPFFSDTSGAIPRGRLTHIGATNGTAAVATTTWRYRACPCRGPLPFVVSDLTLAPLILALSCTVNVSIPPEPAVAAAAALCSTT